MVNERADVVVFIERRTDAELAIGLGDGGYHLVINAAVDDEPAGGRATLATGSHGAKHGSRNHHFEVGIGLDDDGVVAPELQQALAEACGHGLGDNLAHSDGPRRGNQGHALVVGHHFTDGVVALDDAGQAFGHMIHVPGDLIPDVLAGHSGQRSLLGGLPDAGVSTHPSNGRVPVPHGHREVEGADDADNAKGVPLLVHAVPRTFGMHCESVELAGQTDGKVTDVDHLLDLAQPFL